MEKLDSKQILSLLTQGKEDWRKFREKDMGKDLEISRIEIKGLNLNGYNFTGVHFKNVQFINCELNSAQFQGSTIESSVFEKCYLSSVNFRNSHITKVTFTGSKGEKIDCQKTTMDSTDIFNNTIKDWIFKDAEFKNIDLGHPKATSILFSGIAIDARTRKRAKRNPSITIGINGIYNRSNNSAALIEEPSRGDSMLGGEVDVITQSLRKARRSFNISLSIILIMLVIKFIGIQGFAYLGLQVNLNAFGLIVFPLSFYMMYLCNVYFEDAKVNFPYITTQDGAMSIGRFPWIMSRYWGSNFKWKAIESQSVRLILSFHPILLSLILLSWWDLSEVEHIILDLKISDSTRSIYLGNQNVILAIMVMFLVLALYQSFKLYKKSQIFQLPILFDLQGPQPQTGFDVLSDNVHRISSVLGSFFDEFGNPPDWAAINTIIRHHAEEIQKKEKDPFYRG